MNKSDYVTASEIGEYVYCKRAWWLRLNNLLGTNDAMSEGSLKHSKLSNYLLSFKRNVIIAFLIIILGILLGILSIIFIILNY